MTIKERALQRYGIDHEIDPISEIMNDSEWRGYLKGATEQQRMDFEKSWNWINNLMIAAGFDDYDRIENLNEFKKIMEE